MGHQCASTIHVPATTHETYKQIIWATCGLYWINRLAHVPCMLLYWGCRNRSCYHPHDHPIVPDTAHYQVLCPEHVLD